MTLNRSWLRRGLTSPAPWAKSVPDLHAETLVTFYRTGSADNGFGGFGRDGATITFLETNCNVSLMTESGLTNDRETLGGIVRRFYDVLMDIPEDFDFDLLPRKGDRMTFTDAAGRRVDVAIARCDLPEGLADHVEIESVEFE